MWKQTQIQQYQNVILTNILSSQFVYSRNNAKCEIQGHKFFIKSRKPKKIQYLYLFLTTQNRPYLKKFHKPAKSVVKQGGRMRKKAKLRTWSVCVKKTQRNQILADMLFENLPFQMVSERKVLKLRGKNLDVVVNSAAFSQRTFSLKPKNNYLSGVSLIWRLKWTPKTSLFQKVFVLKHLRILSDRSMPLLEDSEDFEHDIEY